jgi:hypothetical protein
MLEELSFEAKPASAVPKKIGKRVVTCQQPCEALGGDTKGFRAEHSPRATNPAEGLALVFRVRGI